MLILKYWYLWNKFLWAMALEKPKENTLSFLNEIGSGH
jgi:hypothetical protein